MALLRVAIAALLLGAVPASAEPAAPLVWPGDAASAPIASLPSAGLKRAPAPGLSLVRVYALRSDANPRWEFPSPGQIGSSQNHGGTVYIAVYERGYGSNFPVAKWKGSTLSASASYQKEPVCAEIGSTLYACATGQTVIGWLKYWRTPAAQNGSFSYSNSSLAGTFPTYGTKSLAFFVQ